MYILHLFHALVTIIQKYRDRYFVKRSETNVETSFNDYRRTVEYHFPTERRIDEIPTISKNL